MLEIASIFLVYILISYKGNKIYIKLYELVKINKKQRNINYKEPRFRN